MSSSRTGATVPSGSASDRGSAARTLLLWSFASLLLLALFHPIVVVRVRQFLDSPRYSHCLLLPLVAALWTYDRWDQLSAHPRRASSAGLVVFGVAVALGVYARFLHTNVWQHVALLGAIGGLVWAVQGGAWLRGLAFPLGYLALTLPLPKTWDDALTLPLQRVATVISEGAFEAFGWVIIRQGNTLQLPGLQLLIEEQCSGVHSLYALVALSVAWVFFMDRPAWLRVGLVAASVPIAVLANAIRVIVTGVLAYRVDPSYAEGVSHSTAGMIVFALGLGMLLFVDWSLQPDPPYEDEDEGDDTDA